MKFKILMCGPSLTDGGGMASVAQNYLRHMNDYGVTTKYITTHVNGSKLNMILRFISSYFRFIMLLALRRYDLVHIHMTYKGSTIRKVLLSFTSAFLRTPYILHMHTDYSDFYNRCPKFLKCLINKSFRKASSIIVLDSMMDKWIKTTVAGCNVFVIANGVDLPSHNPYNKEATDVLFLGSLCKRKGVPDVCKSIKILDKSLNQNIKFLLCGDDDIGNLKETINEMGIAHRIGHFGWISNNLKDRMFRRSAIMILPSYQEGLPMSILESMAHGIPCISTPIAGIPSVIRDNENGILITPGDVDALASNIKSLMSSTETRCHLSESAYITIKDNFAVEKMMADTLAIYRDVASGNKQI